MCMSVTESTNSTIACAVSAAADPCETINSTDRVLSYRLRDQQKAKVAMIFLTGETRRGFVSLEHPTTENPFNGNKHFCSVEPIDSLKALICTCTCTHTPV